MKRKIFLRKNLLKIPCVIKKNKSQRRKMFITIKYPNFASITIYEMLITILLSYVDVIS